MCIRDRRLAEARGDHLRREIKGLEAELEQIAAESEEAARAFEEAKRVFDVAQNEYQLGVELRRDRRRSPMARCLELTDVYKRQVVWCGLERSARTIE